MIYNYKNTNVNYKKLGDGEDLIVFLHGWGTNINFMLPIVEKFKKDEDYSFLLIDFPPFGKSTEPISPWELTDYVSIVESLIEEENFQTITIIGHSFGGRVAIKIASMKNIKIDNLILLSSAGIKPKFSIRTEINVLKYKFYKKIGSKKVGQFGSKDYKILSPIMKKTFNNIIKENLNKDCEKIESKTLIISGKKDKETPFYMAKVLNKKICGSRLIAIKNGGHFAYIDYLNSIFPVMHAFIKDFYL